MAGLTQDTAESLQKSNKPCQRQKLQLSPNQRLVKIGSFDLRAQHLLIIGILAIAFSVSFMIRVQPAQWGYEINEFDPFFNFRATEYLVENGLEEYRAWNDDKVWYPNGRDISSSSQTMLHITAAVTYTLFGGDSTLRDHIIIFPAIFGALTAIIIFALVRVIGGTSAGLFASLFFAVSAPIIVRGTIGWFKSEPLGLFYGILGLYLFMSGIKSQNKAIAAAKLATGGIIMAFSVSSWGGAQFFVLPLGVFLIVLPLLRKDYGFLMWAIPVFVVPFSLVTISLDWPGSRFITGIGGFLLLGPTAYLIVSCIIQKISKEEVRLRNGLFLLGGTIVGGIAIIAVNFVAQFIPLPSFRYLNAINPFLTTTDPLVDSVAEHATTTTQQSFFFLSILMVFAGIGVWLIFTNRDRLEKYLLTFSKDMIAFALIIGMLGVYISSAFVRLELFASISVIILASVGLAILTSEIFRPRSEGRESARSAKPIIKIGFAAVIVGLLIVPTAIPTQGNWVNSVTAPPTILNGGTVFGIANQDWHNSLEWIKNNTPQDAVVAAWWDYGYWITTLTDRATLADNGTLSTERIQNIARMLLSHPDDAWEMLQEFGADYVLVFIAADKIQQSTEDPQGTTSQDLYLLTGGGDESKKQWFMRIAQGEPVERYLHGDGISGTDYFWNETLLGHITAFTPILYIDPATNQQSPVWQPGWVGVYSQDIKYPESGDGPLRLVHASESFYRNSTGPVTAVLIYEVNSDYNPDA